MFPAYRWAAESWRRLCRRPQERCQPLSPRYSTTCMEVNRGKVESCVTFRCQGHYEVELKEEEISLQFYN